MAEITITIKDNLYLSKSEIIDKIEDFVEYDLGSANYEYDVDVD